MQDRNNLNDQRDDDTSVPALKEDGSSVSQADLLKKTNDWQEIPPKPEDLQFGYDPILDLFGWIQKDCSQPNQKNINCSTQANTSITNKLSSSTASVMPKLSAIDYSHLYGTEDKFRFGKGYKPDKNKPKPNPITVDENDSYEQGPILFHPTLGYYHEIDKIPKNHKKIETDDDASTNKNDNISVNNMENNFFGATVNRNYTGSLKIIPEDSILNAPVEVDGMFAVLSFGKKSNTT